MSSTYIKLIISGDDTFSSRNFLMSLKKQFNLVETINGKEALETDVEEKVLATDLFNQDRKLVLVEGLPKEQYLDVLNQADQNIIIWVSGKLTITEARAIQSLSSFTGREFADFKSVNSFTFTSKFFTKDYTGAMRALDKLSNNTPFEMLIGALSYRARQLILFRQDESPDKLSPFQKQKLGEEASKWTEVELLNLYNHLTKIDMELKSGTIKPNIAFANLVNKFLLPSLVGKAKN